MTKKEILDCFQRTGALLEGHFQLRSGMHSNRFFQAALVLQHPEIAERLCGELAEKFKNLKVETVLSPALGGLIVGHELARSLKARAIFAEKENDRLVLRRGFSIGKGEKIFIAEDVVTLGGRVEQTVELARSLGADVVGVGVIVDRSAGSVDFDIAYRSLIKLDLDIYQPDKCPLCKDGIPLLRPGSK